jgi:hypothetical protein
VNFPGSRAAQRGLTFALLIAAAFACQRHSSPAGSADAQPARVAAAAPEPTYPRTLDRSRYAGSAACVSCHVNEHSAWQASPHGRSVVAPSPQTVLADFGAQPLAVDGGEVRFVRAGDRYFMELHTARETTRHAVDLVMGSGRQHQDYFTRDDDGSWRMLPALWTTKDRRWIATQLYQPASLNSRSPNYWRRRTLVDAGCANCHMSQGGYRQGALGVEPVWLEGPVNCESCHGPAAEHVALQKAGKTGGLTRDLRNVSADQEGRTCGTCHGSRHGFRTGEGADGWPWFAAGTLRDVRLLADGRQGLTTYQWTGHVLSACYANGGMQCSSCHAPHSGAPRALDGQAAAGAQSDKQCIVCHRNLAATQAAVQHGHHANQLRCIACHMAETWIGGTPERGQQVSDHTISIPRPQESLDVGTPNACTSCHTHKDDRWALSALRRFGQKRALEARPWVLAIDAGRKRSPQAVPWLLNVLAAPATGTVLRASALDLLAGQPPQPSAAASIEPSTKDEDPMVRAFAYVALVTLDPDHAETWRDRALQDPHPIVRQTLFPLTRDRARLTAQGLDQFVADSLDWAQRPEASDLFRAAQVYALIGRADRAAEVLRLAEKWSTELERSGKQAAMVRAAVERAGAGHEAFAR